VLFYWPVFICHSSRVVCVTSQMEGIPSKARNLPMNLLLGKLYRISRHSRAAVAIYKECLRFVSSTFDVAPIVVFKCCHGFIYNFIFIAIYPTSILMNELIALAHVKCMYVHSVMHYFLTVLDIVFKSRGIDRKPIYVCWWLVSFLSHMLISS